MISLLPFQKRFIKGATAPGVDVSALSLPRGNGKSWLAAHILCRCLTPRDKLFEAGAEYILCAGSLDQARIVFRFVRAELEERDAKAYRFLDSTTKVGITHLPSNTRLKVMASNGKTAMGIVGCPILVADEPGAWENTGGQLLADAIETALGKPGSAMRVIYIGTLAPSMAGWWHDLVERGTTAETYVQVLRGDLEKWDSWKEIRRVNPLTKISPEFRKRLRTEKNAALADSRLKARFLSYRLNLPSADESTMLLDTADWQRMMERPVPERQGQPIVGVDLGGGRAWSSAVALWPTGRLEALAVAPGIPEIAEQEKRDNVPAGVYQKLANQGGLRIADGLRVQPPSSLWQNVVEEWGYPALIVCDRFRLKELWDAVGSAAPIESRISRWSDAAFDIRALRKQAKDGPFAVAPEAQNLMLVSLAAALVKNDDQGNTRLVKRSTNNTGRDDVAAGLVLAAGAAIRYSDKFYGAPEPAAVEGENPFDRRY